MSDFDVSMRLHKPEEPPRERKPLDMAKAMTAIQIFGAILTIPVGVAGVYAAYRSNFSTEVTCQALRTTIISTLEKNVDLETKRALARRDVAEFERSCASIDPDAKRVFAGMMAPKVESPAAPAAIVTAPEPAAKPVIKANVPPSSLDPITEAIEREAARVPPARAPATVATPLTTPAVKHNAAPVQAAKPADARPSENKPQVVERAPVERTSTERTVAAPKGDKPVLGEPPAPLGARLSVPVEANAAPTSSVGSKPLPATPAAAPAVTPRVVSLPTTEPVTAPDTTSSAPMGPMPPAGPPPLETANVPPVAQPYSPPPVAAARPEPREPAKKSGMIPFVSDLFGSSPPRPPGEISQEPVVPENGPAN